MSVIVEVSIPSERFELGRILTVEGTTHVTLETVVPLGGHPTPFVRIHESARKSFEQQVSDHPAVSDIHLVDTDAEETLYALKWEPSAGTLFERLVDQEIALLGGSGDAECWAFELRFPSHEALADFHEYCVDNDFGITIEAVYNPTPPDAGPWYGLTPAQRETLMYAVEAGYYSIPRRVVTDDIAAEFGISDQAVTERLRRAISNLVTNTLLTADTEPRSGAR